VRYAVIERMELPGSWLATARSVAQRQATVYTRPYTPDGERPRWNVWDMTTRKGRRVELEPWACSLLETPLARMENARSRAQHEQAGTARRVARTSRSWFASRPTLPLHHARRALRILAPRLARCAPLDARPHRVDRALDWNLYRRAREDLRVDEDVDERGSARGAMMGETPRELA
jgi:hypothetical protein